MATFHQLRPEEDETLSVQGNAFYTILEWVEREHGADADVGEVLNRLFLKHTYAEAARIFGIEADDAAKVVANLVRTRLKPYGVRPKGRKRAQGKKPTLTPQGVLEHPGPQLPKGLKPGDEWQALAYFIAPHIRDYLIDEIILALEIVKERGYAPSPR